MAAALTCVYTDPFVKVKPPFVPANRERERDRERKRQRERERERERGIYSMLVKAEAD